MDTIKQLGIQNNQQPPSPVNYFSNNMAALHPDIETIAASKVPPTAGELRLLKYLTDNLGNEYEVFYQPFLNGDNPDIVLMRKGSGVIIFEVKDWDLSKYYIDQNTNWRLLENNAILKSPLKQVTEYKDNLYNLHIDTLLEKKITNTGVLNIVQCALYFHLASEEQLKIFLATGFQADQYRKYRQAVQRVHLLGHDSLNKTSLEELIERSLLHKTNPLFTEVLYQSFKRYLKPPFHKLEEGIEIRYTAEQFEIIHSKASRQKIKGLAGSGKTLVLAKRAVNAHKRTGSKVLILTFNLTLKNYIHDRISDVRENFQWNFFYITNYHQFFKSEANNHNLKLYGLSAWEDTSFFDGVSNSIIKYNAIFIDEVQDYRTEWLEIITKYFLAPDGEFVVFGDEKQNIYNRPLDENKEPIIRTVVGRWNRSLKTSKRFTSNIAALARQFQIAFMSQKYNIDDAVPAQVTLDLGQAESEIKVTQAFLDFDTKAIEYFYFSETAAPESIHTAIYESITKHKITPSNIAIINNKIEYIRKLDHLIRTASREKSKTTFETEEMFKHLVAKTEAKSNNQDGYVRSLQDNLEDIRKNKKNHFWINTGTIKLSTVHSFKGWEIHTLFLIIENDDETTDSTLDELIYTGLTRARVNLFIINLGNLKYDDFFRINTEITHEFN